MFHDPSCKIETKEVKAAPDKFSVAGLVAWLEKQPADGTYMWIKADCLVGQYLQAIGAPLNVAHYPRVLAAPGKGPKGPYDGDCQWPYVEIACAYPRTFGAALARARKYV